MTKTTYYTYDIQGLHVVSQCMDEYIYRLKHASKLPPTQFTLVSFYIHICRK